MSRNENRAICFWRWAEDEEGCGSRFSKSLAKSLEKYFRVKITWKSVGPIYCSRTGTKATKIFRDDLLTEFRRLRREINSRCVRAAFFLRRALCFDARQKLRCFFFCALFSIYTLVLLTSFFVIEQVSPSRKPAYYKNHVAQCELCYPFIFSWAESSISLQKDWCSYISLMQNWYKISSMKTCFFRVLAALRGLIILLFSRTLFFVPFVLVKNSSIDLRVSSTSAAFERRSISTFSSCQILIRPRIFAPPRPNYAASLICGFERHRFINFAPKLLISNND